MPRRKKEEQPQEEIKKIKTPPIVKGMKDVLPADEKYWNFVENEVQRIIRDYSFKRVDTPILEKFEMFNHVLFNQTGAAERELFVFTDRGEKLAMRPEATPSIARAYIEHNMSTQNLPIKMYNWGPSFRQGKIVPHKLRQFNQVGFEIIGDAGPHVDAELIITGYFLLKNLGLEGEVKLNSLGCPACRPEYKKTLTEYLKSKRSAVPVEFRKNISRDPLRILNCSTNKCLRVMEDSPKIVDFLCDECRNHLFKVLEYLDELKIPYQLDPTLLRTFDYYNKAVFEITAPLKEGQEEQTVLAAGGRYDNLIEMLGGESMPAAGFSFGIEKLISEIKRNKVELPELDVPDVFVAQLSELARQKAFTFFEALRAENFSVRANFTKSSLKAQLDMAKKMNARIILILGQKEVTEETVIIREQASGIQEVVNFNKVVLEIKKRLKEMKK